MFTGLIETTGTILSLITSTGGTRLVIDAPRLAGRWRIGDSIAVNGVCLTALPDRGAGDTSNRTVKPEQGVAAAPEHGTGFAADLAQETLERTSLRFLAAGSAVNLELPTPAGAPLGGHVVQGHVDGTGTLVSLTAMHPDEPATTDWRLTLELPPHLLAQVVPQGSITVDGISLTVAKVRGERVEIAIIPHTYKSTNLRLLGPGDKLNIETDVLAKYAARLAQDTQAATAAKASPATEWLTSAFLLARGY